MAKKQSQSGLGFIDESWLIMLRKGIKGFTALPYKEQFHLAELILASDKKRWKHYRYPDACAIPYQDLYRRFGRGRFEQINGDLGIFLSSGNWQSEKGEGRAYWLTHKVNSIREKYLKLAHKQYEGRFIYENNTYMRKAPKAITAKDYRGTTARNKNQITSLTPVNAENLQSYSKVLSHSIETMRDSYHTRDLFMPANPGQVIKKAKERLNYIQKLLIWTKTDIGKNRYLLHRYVENKTGRLYAIGSVNLQNAPREVRQAALQGFYDYDIENCHYSLFHQLAQQAGYQTPAIEHYLAKKTTVRQQIASDIGKPVDLVKKCLLAVIYGAEASEYWKAAIPRYLGLHHAGLFHGHDRVMALSDELSAGRRAIVKHHKPSRMGNVRNAMRRNIKATEPDKKILAHLLQGIESKILEIARELYQDSIILMQHDGFTSQAKLDYSRLINTVKRRLGFRIEMSEELLQIPSYLVADDGAEMQLKPNRETQFSILESTAYDDLQANNVS